MPSCPPLSTALGLLLRAKYQAGLWLAFQPPHFLRTVSRDNFPLVRIWARPTR